MNRTIVKGEAVVMALQTICLTDNALGYYPFSKAIIHVRLNWGLEAVGMAARQLLSRHLLSATFAIEIFYRRTITTDMANLNETKTN